MTQEEKELLLKDLCARLPYGVKAQIRRTSLNLNKPVIVDLPIKGVINFASTDSVITVTEEGEIDYDITDNCKPYLRPMSSMTKEEKKELVNIRPYLVDKNDNIIGVQCNSFIQISECQDWLNKKGFDYLGLIPMGLALEAPEDMYKN